MQHREGGKATEKQRAIGVSGPAAIGSQWKRMVGKSGGVGWRYGLRHDGEGPETEADGCIIGLSCYSIQYIFVVLLIFLNDNCHGAAPPALLRRRRGGAAFHPCRRARRILALSAEAAQTARQAERGELGRLRIGFTSSTPLTEVFNKAVNAYRKQFPGVTLSFSEMSTLRQVDALRDRSIDLGFIRPPEIELPHDVAIETLRRDPLVLVTPVNHALARRPAVSIAELADFAFVTFRPDAGTGVQGQVLRLCREAGFEPKIALQAGEGSTIIGLVAAGCGISILPESFTGLRVKGVSYRRLSDRGAVTQLALARRGGESLPLIDHFFKLAIRAGTETG
jgi:DNA-binding transcriptional LysR family regulator